VKVLIIGAGEVGHHLAGHLAGEGLDVVVLDRQARALQRVAATHDVQTLEGSGSSPQALQEAGVADCDLVIAVTDTDEVNLVACTLATRLGKPDAVRIARIRDDGLAREAERPGPSTLGIARAINPEQLAAERIVHLLRVPAICELIEFEAGRVQVVGLKIPGGSSLIGCTISDLASASPTGSRRVLYGALQRQGRTIIPRGDTESREGDVLHAVTRPTFLARVVAATDLPTRPTRHVVVSGVTPVARQVAARLSAAGIAAKLIVPDEERGRQAALALAGVLVLQGEPTDRGLLEQEEVGRADAFVAAGPDDEENVLAALLARQLGVPRTVIVVNRATYLPLLSLSGIDAVISPRLVAVSSILTHIRRGHVLQVASLGEVAEALEFEVPPGAPLTAAPLGLVGFPRTALVVAALRDGEVRIPGGADQIAAGDRVIVFALRSAVPAVEKACSSRRRFARLDG